MVRNGRDWTGKRAWRLAASPGAASAASLKALYGKRWSIECGLRDTKELRFGMGMGSIHVSTPARRDRPCLIAAFAIMLLTLLGAAGEAFGYDRFLKSNTAKRRTHSLFRQGCMLYELMPIMPAPRLGPVVRKFANILGELPVFAKTFGAVQKRGSPDLATSKLRWRDKPFLSFYNSFFLARESSPASQELTS